MTILTEPSYWRWYCLDGIRTGVGFLRGVETLLSSTHAHYYI